MDEKSVNPNTRNAQNGMEQNAMVLNEHTRSEQAASTNVPPRTSPAPQQTTPAPPSSEIAGTEHRQVYGTAKTENLRDSGNWRWILPGFVMLCCLAIFAAPLIIVIPLFINSLSGTSATHSLTWLWVTMFVIEVAVAVFIIRGLLKIFLTQAGNY
jgi:hypothetical protein